MMQRAEARAQRQLLVQQAHDDAQARGEQARAAVDTLIKRVEDGELTADFEDLAQLMAGLGRLDKNLLGDLPGRLTALTDAQAPAELSRPAQAAWTAALGEAQAAATDRPVELMRKAAGAGEVTLAAELMWEALWFDPDQPVIRKALKMRQLNAKMQDRATLDRSGPRKAVTAEGLDYERFDPNRTWFTAFAADRLKGGLVWDPGLGWVKPADKAKYARGGVYDLQRRGWFMVPEANAFHAQPGRPWEIRTEHLLIRGTADLAIMADAGTQLEAFHREIFGIYAGFFSGSNRLDVLRLALGLVDSKPLEIWIYRDREQYLSETNAPVWAGGHFSPATGKAYFFGRVNPTMFHEFTHQILQVFAGKNDAPAWLVEGIAVYTQTATFDRGRVVIPGARPSRALSVDDLMKLKTNAAWHAYHGGGGRQSAYPDAGSLVTYGMNAEDGRFRADLIDFVRDSYFGRTRGAALWDYLGLSEKEFLRGYEAWRGR